MRYKQKRNKTTLPEHGTIAHRHTPFFSFFSVVPQSEEKIIFSWGLSLLPAGLFHAKMNVKEKKRLYKAFALISHLFWLDLSNRQRRRNITENSASQSVTDTRDLHRHRIDDKLFCTHKYVGDRKKRPKCYFKKKSRGGWSYNQAPLVINADFLNHDELFWWWGGPLVFNNRGGDRHTGGFLFSVSSLGMFDWFERQRKR